MSGPVTTEILLAALRDTYEDDEHWRGFWADLDPDIDGRVSIDGWVPIDTLAGRLNRRLAANRQDS